MLLFVGDKTVGYWVEEPAKINEQSVEYVPADHHIKNQTNDILRIRKEAVKFVVYDLEQYTINATEIADEILNIYRAGNAEPIFLATSFLPSSELVIKLQQRGFNKFIFAYADSERKAELEKCINGYYNTTSPKELLPIKEEENIVAARKRVMVSVGGACERMGVTTIAMQLVKHLLYCNKKACDIEMNSSGFINDLLEAYNPEVVDDERGKVTFGNVDMFWRQDLIPDILHMEYDYFIYDYGSFKHPDFNKISFLEKDIKVMILGSNPGEIRCATELLRNIFYQDIQYIYNLTSIADQEDILELMEDKADHTYFAEYCPDMFHYVPAAYFEKIFPQVEYEKEEKPKKKPWWRKRNGKI